MVTTVTDNSPQSINTSLFSLDKEVQEIKKNLKTFNYFPIPPKADGNYTLHCVIENGVATYKWQ